MRACAEAAGQVLKRLDQVSRGLVITGCFDEIFFHGNPVLVGVEPHSMAWVLRMHQGRHRTVTQPMLDLKRLYWNCRPFRSGKRRAHSPYENFGLPLPTADWWQLLHTPPADLTQQVSKSEVTI